MSDNQDIILDSNILGYLSDKNFGLDLKNVLVKLQNNKFNLSISEITIFELLKLKNRSQKEEDEGRQQLSQFKRYFIESNVLITASQMSLIYNSDKIPNDQISTEDLIIGATSVLTGSLIFTADIYDFPTPYFKVEHEYIANYKKKNKSCFQVFHFLSPDIDLFNRRLLQIRGPLISTKQPNKV